jgi:putative membrane protein
MAVATAFLRRGRGVEIGLVLLGVLLGVLIYLSPPWLYPWVKAVHIVAIIAWMAGMLYLPRLFVYHAEAEICSKQSETFKIMERRLLTVITTPAMVASWALGLWLAWSGPDPQYGWFTSGWLWAKLALVLGLSGAHGFFIRCVRDFAADRNRRSGGFYRAINEVPTLLMIAIVLLVVVKPF